MVVRRVLLGKNQMQLAAFNDNGEIFARSKIIDISRDANRLCRWVDGKKHYIDEEDIDYELTPLMWRTYFEPDKYGEEIDGCVEYAHSL